MLLDAVRIGTDDLAAAVRDYATLLGAAGTPLPGAHRFTLARGAVELVAGGPPGLHAVRFVAPVPPAVSFHGITVETVREAPSHPAETGVAIDHVVVRTTDPERAIVLWREDLGLRLAFDQTFPARGVRLLFFRTNGITLEYAAPEPPAPPPHADDALWGVSYRVPDLAACRARLLAHGTDVSEPRPGNKRGTTVASVRDHTAGVPTLLLQNDPA